jgi:CPA2 family monovalent cation:H+ antiporter-2
MDFPILRNVLLVILLVLTITIIFRYIRLPVILGYLVVGAVAGPHGFNFIQNMENMRLLASFGVVFLMFTVGLEFSMPKMMALRKEVFLLGGLQVSITIVLTMVLGMFFDWSWLTGLIVGSIVAMSSTTIVAKQLAGRLESNNRYWQNAISILLFQDLAVIPLLILVSGVTHDQADILPTLSWALIKGFVIILVILAAGRWLFRPFLHTIASTRLIEIFTLAVLLISLGAAWLTHYLGLSFILGAFLAGMMLAETRFRHQIEAEVRPFRDVLLGLFFVSIGSMLNASTWPQTWPWIAGLLAAMIIGKCLIITLLSMAFRQNPAISFRTGLVLAQGGEFGFALLTVALTNQILSPEQSQVILGALLLSLAVAPFLINSSEKISETIFPKKYKSGENGHKVSETPEEKLNNHVIICGYGTIGQTISRLLELKKIPYTALDLEPDRVHEAGLIGRPITFGDASQVDIIKAAGVERARAVVITFSNIIDTQRVLYNVQSLNPKVPTVVRCKNDMELVKLRNYGPTKIIVESHEESLMLTYYLLLSLNVPRNEAQDLIQDVRQEHEDLLEEIFTDSFSEDFPEQEFYLKQLHSIIVPEKSLVIGKTLDELHLDKINIKIVAIRRGKNYNPKPKGNIKLRTHDILLLYGTWENLDHAEEIIISAA